MIGIRPATYTLLEKYSLAWGPSIRLTAEHLIRLGIATEQKLATPKLLKQTPSDLLPMRNFSGGDGSVTSATVALTVVSVISFTVTNGGSGYTSSPAVNITGGGGNSAAASACFTARPVGSVTVTNGGNWYTSAPSVFFRVAGAAAPPLLQ